MSSSQRITLIVLVGGPTQGTNYKPISLSTPLPLIKSNVRH